MALTPTRLYMAQPGTTATTLYTVAASPAYAIVKEIVITNTTASAATMTIGINGTAAANQIVNISVPGTASGSTTNVVVIALSTVLNATDTLQALQGTASACTVEVSGIVGP